MPSNFVVVKRILVYPFVFQRDTDNVPQFLHVLGHDIGRTLALGEEISLKITQKIVVDVLNRHVMQVVPVQDETGKMPAGIATVVIRGLCRVNPHHFLPFRIVPVEQFQQGLAFGFNAKKNVLTFSAVT
jgi:hypothetical protein